MGNKVTFDGKNLEPIPEYNSDDMRAFLERWNNARLDLFVEKDKSYGGSWMQDGVLGAYYNLKRKMDRIITRFRHGKLFDASNDTTNESNIDTFMDLENYSSMNIGFMFFTADEKTFKVFCSRIEGLDKTFKWDAQKGRPTKIQP